MSVVTPLYLIKSVTDVATTFQVTDSNTLVDQGNWDGGFNGGLGYSTDDLVLYTDTKYYKSTTDTNTTEPTMDVSWVQATVDGFVAGDWPDPSADETLFVSLERGLSGQEIIRITSRAGSGADTVYTASRAARGSYAKGHGFLSETMPTIHTSATQHAHGVADFLDLATSSDVSGAVAEAEGYTDSAIADEVTRADLAYDAIGAAATAESNAQDYTDSAIGDEVTRADGAYDALGAAATAESNANDYTDSAIAAIVDSDDASTTTFDPTGVPVVQSTSTDVQSALADLAAAVAALQLL